MLIKGDTFRDRSIFFATPTRGREDPNYKGIPPEVHASHLSLDWPANVPHAGGVCVGHKVDIAFNKLVEAAQAGKFSYLFTLEDDVLPPQNVIPKLLETLETYEDLAAVSALYYTKQEDSSPLLLGHPDHPEDFTVRKVPSSELIVEVNAIPMGCALWRMSLFRAISAPWFQTTDTETQDVYFCKRARALSFQFAVDCSLRAGHLDATTGAVY